MRVRHDRQAELVCLIDNGRGFFISHLILIDQFDDVNAGFCQHPDFGTGIAYTIDAPAEGFCTGIGPMLDERTRNK